MSNSSPTIETRNTTRIHLKSCYGRAHIKMFILMCLAIKEESRSDGRQRTDGIGYVTDFYGTFIMVCK